LFKKLLAKFLKLFMVIKSFLLALYLLTPTLSISIVGSGKNCILTHSPDFDCLSAIQKNIWGQRLSGINNFKVYKKVLLFLDGMHLNLILWSAHSNSVASQMNLT